MSFITAYLNDRLSARVEKAFLKSWRRELLKHVYGEVLEIGAGTGANIEHYSNQVTRLVLTEPDKHKRRIMEKKISGKGLDNVQISDCTAEQIRAEDESFDCVVAFIVFCCVSNPEIALEEIKRVLKPGGYFVFLEYVAAAEGTSIRRWQNRLNPIWRIVGDNLNRETEEAIITAGLKIKEITRKSIPKTFPIYRSSIRGIAEKPNKRIQPDKPKTAPVVFNWT
jgi:ubiquinone/menaquinone biosynthesis C-methylase UbiE